MLGFRCFAILTALVLVTHSLSGQVPQTISYQGVLTDAGGVVVPDGNYTLTFRFYNVASGGVALWTEEHSVAVSKGVFSVVLGSVTPLGLPFDRQYWLGTSVGANAELVPRVRMTSSAYSLRAQVADSSRVTVAEPGFGQGIIVRDSAGNATHVFSPNGDVTHKGLGTFQGGIRALAPTSAVLANTAGDPIAASHVGNVVIERGSLRMYNFNDEIVFEVLSDGTSYHAGEEEFASGVKISGGKIAIGDIIFADLDVPAPTTNSSTVLPTVLYFARDTTGGNTAGLFSSVSGERPSVYGEKKPPGGTATGATESMIEQWEILNRVSTDLPPEFANFASQQNFASIWAVTNMTNNEALLGQVSSTSNSSAAARGVTLGTGAGVIGQIANTASTSPAVWGFTNGPGSGLAATITGSGTGLLVDHNGTSGNPAIFRSGGVSQARIDKTGRGFFNGGTQTGGADVAEAFEVEGPVDLYEPGDVLVISQQSDRRVEKSSSAYSTSVIGVYATKPGVLLSERHIDDSHDDTVPVGVIGVLPTKVSGENGPIRRGDLLVTSRTSGHAMRGTDREEMLGAVIGKALENFDSNGTGVIRVMVNVK